MVSTLLMLAQSAWAVDLGRQAMTLESRIEPVNAVCTTDNFGKPSEACPRWMKDNFHGKNENSGDPAPRVKEPEPKVLSWEPVSRKNCYWADCPRCVNRLAEENAACRKLREKDEGAMCWFSSCSCVAEYCDTTYIGLRDDGSVVWRVETSSEARKAADKP